MLSSIKNAVKSIEILQDLRQSEVIFTVMSQQQMNVIDFCDVGGIA